MKSSIPLITDFPQQAYYLPSIESLNVEFQCPNRGHFNLIDFKTRFKALYFKGQDELHQWALANQREINIGPCAIFLASPEYLILRKMKFYREGVSGKYLGGIAGIFQNHTVLMDQIWLEQKVDSLGLVEVRENINQMGGPSSLMPKVSSS